MRRAVLTNESREKNIPCGKRTFHVGKDREVQCARHAEGGLGRDE